MANFEPLSCGVISGNVNQVRAETKALIKKSIDPLEIVNNGLVAGMTKVGVCFKNGEMFVPEVLMSSRAMMAGIDLVKPLFAGNSLPKIGKVIIGTVRGDLHDIGKNLVSIMLEYGGFEVIDIGTDIPSKTFQQALKEENPDIVAISALLTTSMLNLKDIILLLKEERKDVQIIIGGAPITEDFAQEVGADAYAPDASSAVDACRGLL